MQTQSSQIPAAVAAAWNIDADSALRISTGLINSTWRVRLHSGESAALQKLSGIFDVSVNERIRAVTEHLRRKGLRTPRLLPACDGSYVLEAGGTWRMLEWIDGRVIERIALPEQAQAAANTLARFEGGLLDCDVDFPRRITGAHELGAHMANLDLALQKHGAHVAHPAITQLAAQLCKMREQMPAPSDIGPERVCHGDPKISNLIFREDLSEGICMVDLDTIGYGFIAQELADAARSWCNPMGEDSADTRFRADYFEAMCNGWACAAAHWVNEAEWTAIPQATANVCLCLTARFAADALNESYFGWDSNQFESASEHNLLRAQGQLQLAKSVQSQLTELKSITRKVFG